MPRKRKRAAGAPRGRTPRSRAALPVVPPQDPRSLHEFLRMVIGIEIPTRPLLPGAAAPFDYLVHTYFEGARSSHVPRRPRKQPPAPAPADCVVWAARGAGKTFLGAVATALDLVFKPGIDIRILGGSLEQSQRMHEHLRRLFEIPALAAMLDARITERRVLLTNGARARLLAQSETSVRGARVQKLRCDEVELFDPEVWRAAQLTTRSMNLRGPWGDVIRGAVEALSTMHQPYGLMWKLVTGSDQAAETAGADPQRKRVIFRWGLIDVLGPCGPQHECGACDLHPDCAGAAKDRDRRRHTPGHVGVADAVRMKSRVSRAVWESEMLCLRPRRSDCVLPEFEPGVHIGDWTLTPEPAPVDPGASSRRAFDDAPPAGPRRRWVAGMDFGIRAPSVVLLAWYRDDDPDRVLHVEAEHAQSDWPVERHARVVLAGEDAPDWPRPAPGVEWIGVDPAGNQRSEQTGISCVAVLRKLGLVVRHRRTGLQEGIELLRARFRPAREGSPPRLLVHRRCVKLIDSLTRYHYPEDRPESLEPVKDGADHAVDALRYLVTCLDRPSSARVSAY